MQGKSTRYWVYGCPLQGNHANKKEDGEEGRQVVLPNDRFNTSGSSLDRKLQAKAMATNKLWPGGVSAQEERDREDNGTGRKTSKAGILPGEDLLRRNPPST